MGVNFFFVFLIPVLLYGMSIFTIPHMVPVPSTISQENKNTTIVRIAVATSESVLRIPHFARIAVIPAKNEDPIA